MSVCKNCGWRYSDKYCPRCGTGVADESKSDTSDVTLSSFVTDEDKKAEIRRNLWSAMHKKSVGKDTCLRYAQRLKVFSPDDYYARFCDVVCSGDERAICTFLNKSSAEDMEMYADSVLDYMCGHMTERLYYAVHGYMTRSGVDTSEYDDIENYAPKFS